RCQLVLEPGVEDRQPYSLPGIEAGWQQFRDRRRGCSIFRRRGRTFGGRAFAAGGEKEGQSGNSEIPVPARSRLHARRLTATQCNSPGAAASIVQRISGANPPPQSGGFAPPIALLLSGPPACRQERLSSNSAPEVLMRIRTVLALFLLPAAAAAQDARSILETMQERQVARWQGVRNYVIDQATMGHRVLLYYERVEAAGPGGQTY